MQDGLDNSSIPVLVVDDEPDLLDVMRFVLESEGFGVETARNGKEALERLGAGWSPGLVLLDLMMPVMNGWTFLDEVSKNPVLKGIPVVVLTASRAEGVPGAAVVLHKPVDLGLLIQTVERLARGAI
ncbi:MAG TPA: response regulator [Kofleriaceae bacterium]|nr:response regulator [Kofleriaceae bacterium]